MKVKNVGSNMSEVTKEIKIFSKQRETAGTAYILISYSTPVACRIITEYGDESYRYYAYRTKQKWSQTTSRHINKWFGGLADAIEKKPQNFFDSLLESDYFGEDFLP